MTLAAPAVERRDAGVRAPSRPIGRSSAAAHRGGARVWAQPCCG